MKQFNRRRAQGNGFRARLAVAQAEAVVFPINVIPAQRQNLSFAAAGEHERSYDCDCIGIDAFPLRCGQGFAQPR